MEKRITYGVIGSPLPGRRNAYIVLEYVGASPVNEYTGFLTNTVFTLYPRRRIVPSAINLTKKEISIFKTRRVDR